MTDIPELQSTHGGAPDARPSRTWAWCRVLLAMSVYGPAWLASAGVALVWFGARAGWRDMRAFTATEGE